jgi:hypothetical protein
MIETDYLVVGAGAVGLIFADELLRHSEAQIVLVDRRHCAGGHWNEAYPFVRLHQPSVYYGAGSRELGSRRIESSGPNAGLYEQASGLEVSAYFEQLMRERLLPSGRVRFFPLHEYAGDWSSDHRICSLATGKEKTIHVKSKLVDTTFYRVSTAATHKRTFAVERCTRVIPPNDLPRAMAPSQSYVVVGGGKTSMDVVIWLVEQGVRPAAITWIVPRDSWLVNRETIQPGDAGLVRMTQSQADRLDAAAKARSLDDLYDRLERADELMRVDPRVRPCMFHGATISRGELGLLRQVKNVIRAGHLQCVSPSMLVFESGRMPAERGALYIDCTARGISWGSTKPVFDGTRITMQIIRDGRLSFSAAAIAYVEATIGDETLKNSLCRPIPYEEHLITWPKAMLTELMNGDAWSKQTALRDWARGHPLAGFGSCPDRAAERILQRSREAIVSLRPRAKMNLAKLIATHEETLSGEGIKPGKRKFREEIKPSVEAAV